MEFLYVVLLGVGLAFLIILAVGQYLMLGAIQGDLEEYIEDCREVERIADPRLKPHYQAVATKLSGVLSKYFPEKD
jgi:hypothetical protein